MTSSGDADLSEAHQLTIETLQSMDAIDPAEWNTCAFPAGQPYNPFLDHAFLAALERSGSVSPEQGWQPLHLLLRNADGTLLAAAPAYIKGHSYGEYVFDHAWADALQRAGGQYYPKLLIAVPFTPATGPRLLTPAAAGDEATAHRVALLQGAMEVAQQLELSSVHCNFMPEHEWQLAGELGLLQRVDQQFHWHNAGYASFEEFLNDLSSRKRKNLRRERREAVSAGVEVEWVTGNSLTEAHWDAFYQFYLDTGARKWGQPYLNRAFFSELNHHMQDQVLLVMCRRDGRYIAGALNFIGSHVLYGRNWGCIEDHRFLHFEACYYQAIDFAISRGLERVEAGAQGAHKVARGYLPATTRSAHWIAHPGLRDAVAEYLERERDWVDEDIRLVAEHTPFRRETN